MDFDKWFTDASKWILPFLGVVWLFQQLFGLTFDFGIAF